MKKCFATMLVIMMMLSLVSCGQKPEETPAPQTTPAVSEPVASTTAPEIPAWKPTKTITLICPFNAGSTGDAFSRPFAEIMSKIAGVNVVVENMGGGSGSVGTNYMLSQPADGYTFSYHSNTGALTTAAGTAPFGVDDVLPLVNICSDYHVLSVLKDSPYKTLDDLVQAELDNPGSVRFGGAQVMGNNHLFALNMFRDAGFTAANYIPYDDGGSRLYRFQRYESPCLYAV